MRVLMLHNRYLVPGGEEQSTAAEVALLRDFGHQVDLLEQDNREIERLGKSRTALGTLWSTDSFRRVRDSLRRGTFDILHVQNFFPLLSPSVYHAASRCLVLVVLEFAHCYRLNHLDLVVADGQPVRWALNLPILGVRAAFPLLAGTLRMAPKWTQDRGLEWLFRLSKEPRRLWRRYLLLSPAYILLVMCQWLGFRFKSDGKQPEREILYG